MAARAMYAGLELLQPLLIGENIPPLGKVVLGTVQGDLHDLGKNLVGIMLKGAGFEVIDIGKDAAPDKFIEVALEKGGGCDWHVGIANHHTAIDETCHRVVKGEGSSK